MMVHYFERTQQYPSMPGQLRIYRQAQMGEYVRACNLENFFFNETI